MRSHLAYRDRLYAAFHDDVERTIAPYYVYVRKS